MTHAFTGLSIIVAATAVSAALVYHAQCGRYQVHPSTPPGVVWVIDSFTGEVVMQDSFKKTFPR